MIRSMAERLTHRVVVRRRLPEAFSRFPLYVSTEGGLKYFGRDLGAVDPMLLRVAANHVHPGDVVWDIGSNVGLFTMAAAARCADTGRVIAFEADTWMINLLRRSIAAAGTRAQIDAVPIAVGATTGISSFVIASRSRATNHLDGYGSTQTGGVRDRQFVPCFTMDDLLDHFPAPDVLKIDVEGAEVDLLEHAGQVLKHRPTLLCEVASENATRVQELLEPHGYALYDADTDEACAAPANNTLALPI